MGKPPFGALELIVTPYAMSKNMNGGSAIEAYAPAGSAVRRLRLYRCTSSTKISTDSGGVC